MSSDTPITVSTTPDGATALPEIRGYRLHRIINHGGMSVVYLGDQTALSREVAIKVMMPQALSDEVSRRRFENEVRTIARLEHPHVVRIHELGRTGDGLPYYSMPYLSRGHLGQRRYQREDGSPDEERVIEIVRALMSALEYAHGRGVVHRDVKAENVLFDDNERPLLADFGIALRRGYGPRVTAAGLAVGSTAYMAPEQARGEEVDGRADLYSLGVLIWEMLTGKLPFQAADALSMAVMHAQDPIPKLPAVLRHWQRFMNCALAKQADDRFESVAAMRAALGRIERRRRWPLLARVRDGATGLVVRLRRTPGPLWATAAVLILTLAGVGLFAGNPEQSGFFRVEPDVPPAAPETTDPTVAMLQPLPEAPLQIALDDARRQIGEQKLTEPEGDNATASVLAAWQIDPASGEVQRVLGELTDALAAVMIEFLNEGNETGAREYFDHVVQLGQATDTLGSPAQQRMREQLAAALEDSVERAARQFQASRALEVVQLARGMQLDEALIARLDAHADAIPRRGQVLPDDPVGAVLGTGGIAIGQRPVSVDEYTRFAKATGREPARCRDKVSPLRLFDPRSWTDPGFPQGSNEPVVCVSLADAQAYARWYSDRTGHRYRLPSEGESRQTAPVISGREVSLWLRECGQTCADHRVRGSSWRSRLSSRPLSAERGYDDVGFRLVREL